MKFILHHVRHVHMEKATNSLYVCLSVCVCVRIYVFLSVCLSVLFAYSYISSFTETVSPEIGFNYCDSSRKHLPQNMCSDIKH